MAARRGCVNSLWSGTERVRIGERLKATLAGVLELEVLRRKHLEMVDAALRERAAEEAESAASDTERGSATSCRQQAASPSNTMGSACQSSPEECLSNSGDVTVQSSSGKGSNSRWSSLSWDASSDLLSPPTPDSGGVVHLDSDSRPSSGFYSVSGSSLSDSCYSVSSDAAHVGPVIPARPPKSWEQVPASLQQPAADSSPEDTEPVEDPTEPVEDPTAPVSEDPAAQDHDATGLSFLSDLCTVVGDSLVSFIIPLLNASSSPSTVHLKPQLDPCYCTDLVSRRTKEVYSYPSPLHAVALQSPLFTSLNQEQSASTTSEGVQDNEVVEANPDAAALLPQQPPTPASVTHLEQYITRLACQYHKRVNSSTPDLTSAAAPSPAPQRGSCTPGKSHGSTQSLSAFENRNTPSSQPGGSTTPCKSLLGNSARVSLSATGKKGTRNSINLGNLPSATGEDLSINLHLNLNLNLAPGLNSNRGLADAPKTSSCGAIKSDVNTASAASFTSLSSATPTPGVRSRSRISTCPSSLSHRYVPWKSPLSSGANPGFGSSSFCRSLDWSTAAPPEGRTAGCLCQIRSAPGSQRSSLIQESCSSPKLSEDSPMVGEISRLWVLSRAVVVGLMEQGVELDIDCFQDPAGGVRGHSKAHLTPQRDPSHDYGRLTETTPQRPIQLSLSVTHSPQSQSSLTPPLSHSNSPIHPYQSIHIPPPPHYSSQCHYQHIPSPSDIPSSTASSPASHPTPRPRSPPRPLKPSPMGATPLSVFRRDSPFQCSLPHNNRTSSWEHGGIQPRGGSLRHSGGGSEGGSRWKKVERDGLYRGKHASHKLVRAATVSSYAKREDYSSVWAEDGEKVRSAAHTPKSSGKLWKGFEGRLWGKESESEKEEMDRAEYGYGWSRGSIGSWRREHRRAKGSSGGADRKPKVDHSPIFSRSRGKEDGERRSSSLRLSRRSLFRSESQGLLVPRTTGRSRQRGGHWVSSFDVAQGGMGTSRDEGVRLLRAKEEDKRLSSTASLFNLSRSQSLEGSCQSLSSLSSPSFSPSPPPRMTLQRSRSLRDLGRKVFGSMRSLSLKRKPSKK
ncbi:LOW QUALITY PROTEIN: uncharacterized protein FYW61_008555 [Anableps anableps]